MGLRDMMKKAKKKPQKQEVQTNQQSNNFLSDFDVKDPFSDLGEDFLNSGNINLGTPPKQKTKNEPSIITFLKKTKDTIEAITKKTEILLKGKPPIAVFRTYSDIVVFHEDNGIKIIVNGYDFAHFSEWDLKGKKWKKIIVKEVLNSNYTGDKVEGKGFLLTKFLIPKTYLAGKLLYYEISVYVGEFKGSLTKPVKVGNNYKRGTKVGIKANLLVVIREYSLVNIGGKFAKKEHILYTGGMLSEDLMKFIKEEKKKITKRQKYKPPELNPLEGSGETDEIIIDKEDSSGSNDSINIGDFGGLGDLKDIFGDNQSNNQGGANDPFADLF